MSDETWWRDEARRLYADVAQARREREATDAACTQLVRVIVELQQKVDVLEREVQRTHEAERTDSTRRAPVSWVAP